MIGTKITRRLQSHFERQFAGLYKVTVIGSTGSGKTTLLKAIVDFQTKSIEQPRRHQVEEDHDLTYTLVDQALKDQKSFTTVSFNSVGIIIIRTSHNTIEFHPMRDHEALYARKDLETIWAVLFFDTAGQIRFDFMPLLCVRGADGVLVFADGTSTTSIERLAYYLELVREEEARAQTIIPVRIFVNKADLREKGLFVGADYAKMIVGDSYSKYVYETTGTTGEGTEEPIRDLLAELTTLKKMYDEA